MLSDGRADEKETVGGCHDAARLESSLLVETPTSPEETTVDIVSNTISHDSERVSRRAHNVRHGTTQVIEKGVCEQEDL